MYVCCCRGRQWIRDPFGHWSGFESGTQTRVSSPCKESQVEENACDLGVSGQQEATGTLLRMEGSYLWGWEMDNHP